MAPRPPPDTPPPPDARPPATGDRGAQTDAGDGRGGQEAHTHHPDAPHRPTRTATATRQRRHTPPRPPPTTPHRQRQAHTDLEALSGRHEVGGERSAAEGVGGEGKAGGRRRPRGVRGRGQPPPPSSAPRWLRGGRASNGERDDGPRDGETRRGAGGGGSGMEWGEGARGAKGAEPETARGRRATSTRPTPRHHRQRHTAPPPAPLPTTTHTPRTPHASRPHPSSPLLQGGRPWPSTARGRPDPGHHRARAGGGGGSGPPDARNPVRDTARSSPQSPATPRATLDTARQRRGGRNTPFSGLSFPPGHGIRQGTASRPSPVSLMILPQVHLRKPCYDFYFL